MKRPATERLRTRAAGYLIVSVAALLVLTAAAAAQDAPAAARKPTLYGRKGSEIWIEAPRVMFPTGGGYRNGHELGDDYAINIDLEAGFGFGFGIFFAISDNLLFEGRMIQSSHRVGAVGETPERDWDLDQAYVGVRYVFRYEEQLQPSVGLGGLRYSLEWSPGVDDPGEFVRLTGYGGYVSFGLDYMISRRWAALFRAEYGVMSYTDGLFGTDDFDIDSSLDGSGFGMSLGLSYRIPMW